MAMSGSLNECLEKLYELYVEDRISYESAEWYLIRMRHEDGSQVFSKTDANKMLEMLEKAKDETTERVEFEKEEIEDESD